MITALIVDDESLVREAVRTLGQWDEFGIERVLEASNAKTALELFDREHPEVIVTDMKMPVMDGIEFLKELDSRASHPKVIIVSGFDDYDYTRQAIRSNVVDYILKPIDRQELNQALSEAVSRLADLTDTREAAETEELNGTVVTQIEKYIRERYTRDITLSEISVRFFVSKEHISRSFKKQYHINLFDYITLLRLEKAKTLMKSTRLSIEEIAQRTGFSNGNYFSKVFKKHVGESPSEFRNRNGQIGG